MSESDLIDMAACIVSEHPTEYGIYYLATRIDNFYQTTGLVHPAERLIPDLMGRAAENELGIGKRDKEAHGQPSQAHAGTRSIVRDQT